MIDKGSNKSPSEIGREDHTPRFKSILMHITHVANVLAVGFLLLLLVVVLTMVLARNLMNWGLGWLDDLARYI